MKPKGRNRLCQIAFPLQDEVMRLKPAPEPSEDFVALLGIR